MLTINLHLGAHKTATTYIQNILTSNYKTLNKKGIYSSTPSELRGGWLDHTLNNNTVNQSDKHQPSKEGLWIISEENILGVPNDFKTSYEMYPRASNRLLTLKETLGNTSITVFLSIRCYHSFYRSCYLEVVRNKGYLNFSDYYDEQRFKNNNWVHVIEKITENFPESDIILWCYEEFTNLEQTILKKLTGLESLAELDIDSSKEKKRTSLSNRALKELIAVSTLTPRSSTPEVVEALNLKYPTHKKNQPFMPFSQVEITRFKEKYNNDIEEIKTRFPGIIFLSQH